MSVTEKQPCYVVEIHNVSQIMYLYYAPYILMRHNLSEFSKVVSFLGSDLLWVYGKSLSVEQSRAEVVICLSWVCQ